MPSFTSRQWITVACAVVLLISLFFINRKSIQVKEPDHSEMNGSAQNNKGFDTLFNQAEKQVSEPAKTKISSYLKALNTAPQPIQVRLYDSIILVYDSIGMQLQANYYNEKIAGLQHSSEKWSHSGEGYYNFSELINATARTPVLQRAITCFTNALSIDSSYLNAKVGLGQCIVQSGGNPMQGIAMIEDVLKKDSNNLKAQSALGEFSMQSGQYAKAINRFQKVLKIAPDYIKAYLYLAQAYESSGDKKTAVSYLKKYSTFATDTSLKRQVDDYVKKFEAETKK